MDITVRTTERTEFVDITPDVQALVRSSKMHQGHCLVYVPHTTAGVTINESADPDVVKDILMVLNKMVPWEDDYRHGEGNSPAHVKSALVGSSQWVPVGEGRLLLGTWQGIFFCEFDGPRTRRVHVSLAPTSPGDDF